MEGIKIRMALIFLLIGVVVGFVFTLPETASSANSSMEAAVAHYQMAKPHHVGGVLISDQPGTYKAYIVQLLQDDIVRSPRLLTDANIAAACDIAGDEILGGMPDNLKEFCSLR